MKGKHDIYIKDISEVLADKSIQTKIKNIRLSSIHSKEKKHILISVLDIVKAIEAEVPGNTVTNLGEIDIVVEYSPEKTVDNPYLKWLKIIFVILVLSLGSATAIMSFHSDGQMPIIFSNYYYMVFNERIENPKIIDIPYSIGIASGIIIFFNHFGSKKITNDPTPIEVEMSVYEQDVTDTLIDNLNNKKSSGDNNNASS